MGSKKYRLMSIDSSSSKTGYAVYDAGILTASGVLDMSAEKDKEIRLENMCLAIIDTLKKYKPNTVVIEMTVVTRSAATQRLLSEIVGVVRGWAVSNYAEFVEYRPTVWRKLIVGPDKKIPKGRTDCKAWSIETVRNMYNKNKGDDECDAILIGQARINEIAGIENNIIKSA